LFLLHELAWRRGQSKTDGSQSFRRPIAVGSAVIMAMRHK
jgi:hypothetical protein